MKQVGMVVALVLASANMSEAQDLSLETGAALQQTQAPRLNVNTQLEVDPSDLRAARLSLHAPITLMVTGAVATAALGMSTAISSLTHCHSEDCGGGTPVTPILFAATLAAGSLAIASLAWVLKRSIKRRRARAALQALDVFGSGMRF